MALADKFKTLEDQMTALDSDKSADQVAKDRLTAAQTAATASAQKVVDDTTLVATTARDIAADLVALADSLVPPTPPTPPAQ